MTENLSKIIENSHAVIVEIPRNFGFDFAKKQIEFPENSEIFDFLPRIHSGQKTEIINVDDVREIQQKVRGKTSKRQFFVICDGEKMNEEAQNKFLKLFEEPRANLTFVILVYSAENLLETVRSRAQISRILPISNEKSEDFLRKFKLEDAKKRQILFLASGMPGEMEKLATDKKHFEKNLESVEIAKKWLSGGKFERLIIANSFKNDREKALDFIEKALKIIEATLNEKTALKNATEAKKLLLIHRKISKNANIRVAFLREILA